MTPTHAPAAPSPIATRTDPTAASSVQCDRMCGDCTNTCTRDYGHSGPHRCDTHARG